MLSNIEAFPPLQHDGHTFKFETGELSPENEEIAKRELRETPQTKKEAILALRNLLKEETDLKTPYDNDLWLVKFLRPCKFYPESAFEMIKRYYAFKVKHANVYDGLLPSKEQNVFQADLQTVQPNRDQFGRRILVIELGKKWKHKEVTLDEVFKGGVLLIEAFLLEPATQVSGVVVMFDMNGLSLQQTLQFTPLFAKKMIDWLQDSIPVRVKNFHIVNEPYIFNVVFALFKPFLREKLKNRIVFHGTDRKSLQKYISPECLTLNYGGTLITPRIRGPQWLEVLLVCDKEYEAINSYGYKKDQSK